MHHTISNTVFVDLYDRKTDIENRIRINCMLESDRRSCEDDAMQNNSYFHGGFVDFSDLIFLLKHHGYDLKDIEGAVSKIKAE